MELKPEGFFIGVIDFFSVMLPGAVLAFLVKDKAMSELNQGVFPEVRGEVAGWTVLTSAQYNATAIGPIEQLIHGTTGMKVPDLAVDQVCTIKEKYDSDACRAAGPVDEATVQALNELLKEHGELDQPPQEQMFVPEIADFQKILLHLGNSIDV